MNFLGVITVEEHDVVQYLYTLDVSGLSAPHSGRCRTAWMAAPIPAGTPSRQHAAS